MLPREKVLLGTAGVVGTTVLAWRTLFPWIGDDIKVLRKFKEARAITDKHMADGKMIVDLFEEDVLRTPRKPFIIFEDRFYTYELVNEQANRVANLASQWGLTVGDTVAIMIGNEPAFIWTYLGLQKLGITVAFINSNIKRKALVHSLKSCDTKVLILAKDEEIFHAVDEIRNEISETPVYVQGRDIKHTGDYLPWDDLLLATLPVQVTKSARAGINFGTTSCFIFTSGTTGLPKPAIVSQQKALSCAVVLLLSEFRQSDIMYTTPPLYHSMAGGIGIKGTIATGGTMVLRRNFSARNFWEDVRKYDITYIQYVGEMLRYLLALPQFHDERNKFSMGHSARFGFHCCEIETVQEPGEKRSETETRRPQFQTLDGANATKNAEDVPIRGKDWTHTPHSVLPSFGRMYHCPNTVHLVVKCHLEKAHPLDGVHKVKAVIGNGLRQDIWEKFQTRFRVPRIYVLFVATDATASMINLSNQIGACGRMSPILNRYDLIPKYIIEVDPITGDPVRDKDGHCKQVKRGGYGLLITGIPQAMQHLKFYKGDIDMNEKKVIRNVFVEGDAYLNYGDLVQLDKDYFIYFKDRLGDTYRWKGENVATFEVANVLTGLDFIQDANVYGVHVPGTEGRAGMAALHLHEGVMISNRMLEEIYKHCSENLPSYAQPLFLRIPKEMIITGTFKQRKVEFVKEGYDPSLVADPLYSRGDSRKTYCPLTHEVYGHIRIQSKL